MSSFFYYFLSGVFPSLIPPFLCLLPFVFLFPSFLSDFLPWAANRSTTRTWSWTPSWVRWSCSATPTSARSSTRFTCATRAAARTTTSRARSLCASSRPPRSPTSEAAVYTIAMIEAQGGVRTVPAVHLRRSSFNRRGSSLCLFFPAACTLCVSLFSFASFSFTGFYFWRPASVYPDGSCTGGLYRLFLNTFLSKLFISHKFVLKVAEISIRVTV